MPILHDNLKQSLTRLGLDAALRGVHLVVAYSGGPDSTALLHALCDLRDVQKLDLKITAAWVNHAWRESAAELPVIHQNVLSRNIPLIVVAADKTLSKTEGPAREYRYKQLTQLAEKLDADAVVTAHHADDQVETILFRLLRGTGVDGLCGIHRRLLFDGSTVPVVRPMLDTPREAVKAYLAEKANGEHRVRWFEDPTNADVKHQRNLIRQKTLPQLQQDFPGLKNALFKLAMVAEGDAQIIEERIAALWPTVSGKDKEGQYLKADVFSQLDTPYQRRLVRRFLHAHGVSADFQAIEETLEFVRGDRRRKIGSALKSLAAEGNDKRFLSLYQNRVRVLTPPRATKDGVSVDVGVPGVYMIPALGLCVETRSLKKGEPSEESFAGEALPKVKPLIELSLDPELGGFKGKALQLRTRKPGDKFQPAGMPVPLRLKRWLINRGIPRFKRDEIPVLACGEHVLWARDFGMSLIEMVDPQITPEAARSPVLSVTIRPLPENVRDVETN